MFALKLPAGRLLPLSTQNLSKELLGSLKGVLEHGSQPEPAQEQEVMAPTPFYIAASSPKDGWVSTGPLHTSWRPVLTCTLIRGEPCWGKVLHHLKARGGWVRAQASLIHCVASLHHHFCPCSYRLGDNLCYLYGENQILVSLFHSS